MEVLKLRTFYKMHYFEPFCSLEITKYSSRELKKISQIFSISRIDKSLGNFLENWKNKSNCMQTVKTNNPIVWQTKSNCMQTVKTNNPIGWQTVKTNNPIGWQTKHKKKWNVEAGASFAPA